MLLFLFAEIPLPDFIWYLKVIGILSGGVLLLYIIVRLSRRRSLLISNYNSTDTDAEGEQYYFLPTASITIDAVASIIIKRSLEDKKIIDWEPGILSVSAKSNIEPDTSKRITLNYVPDWFCNDEFKIKTNENGLLDTVSAISEDRLVKIVEQLTSATDADKLNNIKAPGLTEHTLVPFSDIPFTTEVLQFSRSFYIPPEKLKEKEIKLSWIIPLENPASNDKKLADISFSLEGDNLPPVTKSLFESTSIKYTGILTRSIKRTNWKVVHIFKKQPEITVSCLLPDTSSVFKIPVKRASFVKQVKTPGFSNGLLVENYYSKPSELEGFLSIPINILKAIVSIPAQLLHFRITHYKQEADVIKALKELENAKAGAAIKADKDKETLSGEIAALKKKLEDRPGTVTVPEPTHQQEPIPKLGKRPPSSESQLANTQEWTTFKILKKELAPVLPPPKARINWGNRFPVNNWNDYNNTSKQTCVPAAAAHLIISWSFNSSSAAKIPSLEDVLFAWKKVSGSTDVIDQGCDTRAFLKYWRLTGIGTDMINRFLSIRIGDLPALQLSVYWFGGCLVGLKMPASAQDQKLVWGEYSPGETNTGKSDAPGSWQEGGGHAVAVIGYDEQYLTFISWGKVMRMTNAFYTNYNDESYIVLSGPNWAPAPNGSPTDPRQNFEKLAEALDKI